jgi:DNA-binding response OmpR family regulator
MARIFVVEDDPNVQRELLTLLRNAGHDATAAKDFSRVAQDALASNADLVLLDLTLPGTDGQYVAREIRQASEVPIVVLTSRTTDLDELMSMSMGADAFVAKPYNGQVLLAHIDAILRRTLRSPDADRVVERNGVRLDLSRSTASANGREVKLTKNETRILELLMRRSGRIVTREELMEALWSSDAFVDDNTLTVNVNRLRQTLVKLGVTNYVTTHRGQGYSA